MKRFIATATLSLCASISGAEQMLPENEYDCFIVPHAVADVGSPVRGVVQSLLVDRGDTVAEDQVLAKLESGTEKILLKHAEARADMRSELAAREADFALAELEMVRMEGMHRKSLVSTQQRDEARARKQIAQSGLVQAMENHKLALIELQRATHDLAQRTIRSPANGVVVEQYIVPGEFIYDKPIMQIATLNPLRIEVVLPAALFGSIVMGSDALITAELDPDNPLEATVDTVDAMLDTRSGTFGVRLELSNDDLAVVAGQKCVVDFQTGNEALRIAEEAG